MKFARGVLAVGMVPLVAGMVPLAAAAPVKQNLATAKAPPPAVHVVAAGETLIGLGERVLARARDWRVVARVNRVGDPRRLPVGKMLVIPDRLLRREAQVANVVAFSGNVGLEPGGPTRLGAQIGAGGRITTGANSFVTLGLADGSRVTLPSQSVVRIETLDRLALGGRLERRFVVEQGRSDFGVSPRQNAGDRFLVKTPVAVAAVRGTEFRVKHIGAISVISVVEGNVASRPHALAGETSVPAGSAAVHDAGSARTKALLPAPALLRPGKVQDDAELVFAVHGAGVRRLVQLARDAGFVDLFAETETNDGEVRFAGIANGTIYVRVTAVDAEGVEGLPSSYEVERFLSGVDAEAGEVPGKPRRTLFRWQPTGSGTRSYDFVLARDAALTDRIVDAPGLAGTEIGLTALPPGVWYWRITVTAIEGGKRFVKELPVRTLTIARPER
ncbi:peptidoglycan-binding protein LysM [Polymorphobacter glacialis]|uniref:Peptidoglycan-binding protein LysM n=1 Tax=Sandarakinorhabdus glacialis TaxID=1614636 RepID=A0A917EAY8_9SPHN|nr:FecR domain-containing protein [Polymorphobacter glacialis]GGE19093.1 peptidoglycan-binding protein LysM [Polymorphobacter glacialis]